MEHRRTPLAWVESPLQLLGAAGQSQALASVIANNFDDPRRFAPWWFDAQACQAFIAKLSPVAA